MTASLRASARRDEETTLLPVPSPRTVPTSATLVLVLYVHLWLVEGALRKWVFPSAGTALYVARDALFVMAAAWVLSRRRRHPWTAIEGVLAAIVVVVALLTALQILIGRVNPLLGLLGARSYVVGVALALFALRTRSEIDVRLTVSAVVIWLPVNAVLCVAQALSPQNSFINQVGEDEFQALSTAEGVSRASGTFTASVGLSVYALLALALALALASERREGSGLLPPPRLIIYLACALVVVAVAGSRTLLAGAAIVVVGYLLLVPEIRRERKVGMLLVVAVAAVVAVVAVPSAISAFQDRIEVANQDEDSQGRLLDTATQYNLDPLGFPLLGDGAGSHSSVGRSVERNVVWIENDVPRATQELGLTGFLLSLARQVFAPVAVVLAWRIRREVLGRSALMVALALFPILLFGQITAQPSVQGFAALGFALFAVVTVRKEPLDA